MSPRSVDLLIGVWLRDRYHVLPFRMGRLSRRTTRALHQSLEEGSVRCSIPRVLASLRGGVLTQLPEISAPTALSRRFLSTIECTSPGMVWRRRHGSPCIDSDEDIRRRPRCASSALDCLCSGESEVDESPVQGFLSLASGDLVVWLARHRLLELVDCESGVGIQDRTMSSCHVA